MKSGIHILGIRHHGPGSARSMLQSLEAIRPDVILLEGPPDAQDILALAAEPGTTPPVALLVYRPDELKRAVYYPFAEFSPEWQAIRFGAEHNIPVRFMDLPQSRRLALEDSEEAGTDKSPEETPASPAFRKDPLRYVAQAAGFEDSERWWEHQFETRYRDEEVFTAVLELMSELRAEAEKEEPLSPLEAAREAHMRQTIREARKEGFEKMAVVCGAWHGPALVDLPPAARDKDLIQALPKCKTTAAWVPWTYGRLLFSSGYGAGIESPGYYGHLWENRQAGDFTERWMAKVARLFREEDLESSTASVIESSRLADTLAALRGRAVPGLAEFHEAARAVFCFGSNMPLSLLNRKLVVGERLGRIPEAASELPIQSDLRLLQKRLRMMPQADDQVLELDLRKESDLERSRLLHRLRLLDIPWGKTERSQTKGKGTFRETWRLRWDPEFEIRLIEASVWGNSVRTAVAGYILNKARTASSLPELAEVMQDVFLADLPEIVPEMVGHLQNLAAVATDMGHLMAVLPPLAEVFRYGDVRQSETSALRLFVKGLVARICVGLPGACTSLGDEAAAEMLDHFNKTHAALANLQEADLTGSWSATLAQLADMANLHGLIAGRCCRLLLDGGNMPVEEAGKRLQQVMGPGCTASQTASWIEGFLSGSGLMLLHNPDLWGLIDRWLQGLSEEIFIESLPLLRRTFSTFPAGERRQMQDLARKGSQPSAHPFFAAEDSMEIEESRADLVLPILGQLLRSPAPATEEEKKHE